MVCMSECFMCQDCGLLAEGIRSCSNALQEFYSSSKQLSDLDSGKWQESEMDATLCKAGLW